jgi:ferritin-like metal-binding protein YciE
MNTAWDLFVHELRDMLNAENKLVRALGEMERESKNPELQEAFREHRKQTEVHAERLIDIMRDIGQTPEQSECKGVDGLVQEKKMFMEHSPSADVLEVFNIGAGIKAERYEISAYESLARMAEELGALNSARLLRQTLNEEQEALHKLQDFSSRIKVMELGIAGNIEGGLPRKAA